MTTALVVQTSFLGDVVLTTPLIHALSRRHAVTVVATPAAAPLLAGNPDISRVVPWDKRGRDAGLGGLLRLARAVAAPDREAVACLAQGSHRSGALARLAGYRRRVGFATSAGRLWYSSRISVPPGTHHVERLWRLAESGTHPDADALRPRLHPSPADRAIVDDVLRAAGAGDDPLIALAPGSVWATKRWPGFAALARSLSERGRVVVVGGPGDAGLASEIRAAAPEAIDATGRLPLLASAALIGRARVLVTNDSLPLHLASAMDTPTVAVFGPTVPLMGFGPLASRRAVAEVAGLPCRPCHAHGPRTCPLGHFRCMRDLSPAAVADRVASVLQ